MALKHGTGELCHRVSQV